MRKDAIVQIVHQCIDESPRIGRLEADVSVLKSDVAVLKSDVSVLKSDVSELKSDLSALKDDHRRHGIILEDLRSDMNRVIEVVMDGNRILNRAC
jgi:hypothetical protein